MTPETETVLIAVGSAAGVGAAGALGVWALARRSVTEPLITLRFEAHTEEELARIQERVRVASPRLARLLAEAGL